MRRYAERGFTLLELILVIVIVGALAGIAVPRLVDLGPQARIKAVQAGVGAVYTAAHMAGMKCRLTPGCSDANTASGTFVRSPDGELNGMFYGFPTGLTRPNAWFGIKDWVRLEGFTVVEVFYTTTEFRKDGAVDPSNCKVTYIERVPTVYATTSGC